MIDPITMIEEPMFKFSLCLTNYNRSELLFEGIRSILQDNRVNEIVISDDHSKDEIYQSVVWYFKDFPKVKIYRNDHNLDCYQNKAQSLKLATNDWCILFDSDNVIDKSYIDRIENIMIAGVNPTTIYTPSFARPHFDFTGVAGVNISRSNIAGLMNGVQSDKVGTMLNAANYFVNRHEYLKLFTPEVDPVTSDSIFMASRWIEAGNSIYVVPDLSYQHRVNNHGAEEGSHYGANVRRTPQGFHDNIVTRLKRMK